MTTAAHECITGLLDLLEKARRPQDDPRSGLATQLLALADAAESAGCAPETDAVLGADARELAARARRVADALTAAPCGQRALAA